MAEETGATLADVMPEDVYVVDNFFVGSQAKFDARIFKAGPRND